IWVHYMRDEWVRRAGRRRLFLRPRHREAPPLLAAFLDPAAFELPIHALHPPRKQALAVVDLEREGLAVEGGVDDRPALLASLHGQDGGPSELSLIEAELQLDGARPGRRVPLLDRSQPPGADHLRGGGVLRGLRGRLDGMEQGGGCDEQEPERKQTTSLCHEMSSRRVGLSAAVGSSWIAGGHMASLLFGWTRSRRCGRRVRADLSSLSSNAARGTGGAATPSARRSPWQPDRLHDPGRARSRRPGKRCGSTRATPLHD